MIEFKDTDPTKWHLKVKNGRQTWHYIDDSNVKQDIVSKYWLGLLKDEDLSSVPEQEPDKDGQAWAATKKAMHFFKQLQTDDGHWAGEYGGPLFLLAGIAVVFHITGQNLEEAQRVEIIRYIKNTVAKEGGWGLHIEGHSIMLCTVLNYVVLRLLGVDADDSVCVKAREFIHRNGGATNVPSWGKFWLACLNVYEWEGMNALIPELWLLPTWVPIHPSKMWCHARQIYLPMSYCYGIRFKCQESRLIQELRHELYVEPYSEIDWVKARDLVAQVDCYAPHHKFLDVANMFMNTYDKFYNGSMREKALQEVLVQVRYDDLNTNYISIGPISKMIQMLIVWIVDGPNSHDFIGHLDRVRDYLWIAPDGMRMQGTNGSQLWDTSFAAVAIAESGLAEYPEFEDTCKKTLEFLNDMHIKDTLKGMKRSYRTNNVGGFPFSTRECGWIVSDCTAEGLKAVLMLQGMDKYPNLVSDSGLFKSVDLLLKMQNEDFGFASYEERRAGAWMEYFNPSEVFGEIMVDYSYTECSSSVVQALHKFAKLYPNYRNKDIMRCIDSATQFIRDQQRDDGSWFGSWGICFTYAMFFALEALSLSGETYSNSPRMKKACEFLISKQKEDGGWGESYLSCIDKQYIQHESSQVVNTSWAILALLAAKYPGKDRIEKAVRLLISRQLPAGGWAQEGIEGVFNKTCMISYPNYKFIFPMWAMGRYSQVYEKM